ncbi:MAG: hypothetical protein Q4F35_03130 [Akkermansia sp.]|nr:hypothetical protein [Akkermansia sp.]
MKKNIIFWVLVFSAIAGGYLMTAPSYREADTMEQAKEIVNDDGYAIFVYADGWDKYSKPTVKRMLNSLAVGRALGSTVVMQAGIPDVSTKEIQEARKVRYDGLEIPTPDSYPAIHFYNKGGKLQGTVTIMYDECNKPDIVAEKILTIRRAIQQRKTLLTRAEQAQKKLTELQAQIEAARKDSLDSQGQATATPETQTNKKLTELQAQIEATRKDCLDILGQAAAIPGIRRMEEISKQIKNLDPEDKSGMMAIATLNLPHKAIATAGTKDWKATLAEIKGMMDNPLLTTEHRQQLYCISIGLLHRHGGPQHQAELKEMINKLRALDPDSLLGKSAVDAARLWISELNIIEGWSPKCLPTDKTPVELSGSLPIKESGTYEVLFAYKSGTEALRIAAVELYDGDKKIAEDRHNGSTGHKNNNNVYSLNVPQTVANPRLFITFDMGEKRDSYGKITITKK